MIGVPGARLRRNRQCNGKVRKSLQVSCPNSLTMLPSRLHPPQLVDSKRRLNVHHVVFESALDDVIMLVAVIAEALPGILAHPVEPEDPYTLDVLLSPCEDHAPLASRKIFSHIEAEATEIPDDSRLLTMVFRLDCVRAVLDHLEVVSLG